MIAVPPKYKLQADKFLSAYECEKEIFCPTEKITNLLHRSQRICRFCNKKSGEVTFKKEAHIFPYALGNRYLISDFECDSCNYKFSKYEDALCKYLGVERTFSKAEGRKDIPGYVSSNFKATKKSIFDNPNAIKIEPNNNAEVFGFDEEKNCRTIKYKKSPFIPVYVYKAFLKMALCCIEKSDLKYYQSAFRFLSSDSQDGIIKSCMLFGYRLPSSYENMFGVLYKKRSDDLNTMTHTFILYYGTFMFQIFLPFNQLDIKHYSNLEMALMPPLFDGSGDEKWIHRYQISDDLSPVEKRVDEEEIIYIQIDPENLKNMVAIDPITKKVVDKEFVPSDIAGMYMVDKNFKIKLD